MATLPRYADAVHHTTQRPETNWGAGTRRLAAMTGLGSILDSAHGKSTRRSRMTRRLGLPGAVLLSSAALAIAMLPLGATPASATGTWTVTISGTSGATTTGILVNGTVDPAGNEGFAQVIYEPTGTPLTENSPTAGLVIFNAGGTSQPVSFAVDQLTPNTSYTFAIQATEDDNDLITDSSPGTFTTTPVPTGPATPIDPPNDPPANGIFGQCSGDAACVNDMNGVRAAQENLSALTLPSNWSTLSGSEQEFVWTNLERTSRGEAAIPNLVNTYAAAVQTGLTNDADPDLGDVPGVSGAGSIWAGAFDTPLGAMYGWLYDDGPGGENEDCTTTDTSGCWGHRDNILANASSFGNPTEMDAGVGTDSGGSVDYDAIFAVNSNPTAPANIVFTWAEEQPFFGAAGTRPTITGVSLTGTPAAPTVTVTGSNFGSTPPTATAETCQPGDTGNIYTGSGLVFQDLSGGWGAGQPGDCIGLSLTSWSSTQAVFSFGSQYANFGPINAGDQIEATIQGASDTVTAAFTSGSVPTVTGVSPNSGPVAGGTKVTLTGTGFTGATQVLFGVVNAPTFTVVNSTTITVTAPNNFVGNHFVTVTTPGGTSVKATANQFNSLALPTVTGVSPNSGPVAGGTKVTLTGTAFTGATQVLFGVVNAPTFTVVSSTTITVTAPNNFVGNHFVTVTAPGGTSVKATANEFNSLAAPTVTGVSPGSGPVAGGTKVTLTGTGFTGTTQVLFGVVNAPTFTVVNSTTITVTAPSNFVGDHFVTVTAPGGTSVKATANEFNSLAAPTVTGVSPNSGPVAGGTKVTLTGTGFTGTTQVLFGVVNAPTFTVVNSTTITVTAPNNFSGTHFVTVTAPGGTSVKTTANQFTSS
jgi:hypothetical protein